MKKSLIGIQGYFNTMKFHAHKPTIEHQKILVQSFSVSRHEEEKLQKPIIYSDFLTIQSTSHVGNICCV